MKKFKGYIDVPSRGHTNVCNCEFLKSFVVENSVHLNDTCANTLLVYIMVLAHDVQKISSE